MRYIDLDFERDRIGGFIRSYAHNKEVIVVLVSGGLDSDVVARLCAEAVGPGRVHLVTVQQDDMELQHASNAHELASDLGIALVEVDLRGMNLSLIQRLQDGDPELFDAQGLLDPARAKCSVRSALLASYEDKGMLVAGTSNRSEMELGFYMPFGDNLCHFKPLAHLYKTEVVELGRVLSCRQQVLTQDPSAGFWRGQSDRLDLAYWMVNGGPIRAGRQFSTDEIREAEAIASRLTQEGVDRVLFGLSVQSSLESISDQANVPQDQVRMISVLVNVASRVKARRLLVRVGD